MNKEMVEKILEVLYDCKESLDKDLSVVSRIDALIEELEKNG